MEEIVTIDFDVNVLQIKNIPNNQRKYSKLKIFLNANKDVICEFNDNNVLITFRQSDLILINENIVKIINYIKGTYGDNLNISVEVKRIIESVGNAKENFNKNKEELIKEKKEELDSEQFIDFCKFCDSTLAITLRDYQYKAAYYMCLGNGGFDFSVPGAGKTIISYAAYNYMKNKKKIDNIVIIGPLNSYNAWLEEYVTCFSKEPDFTSVSTMKKEDAINYLLSSSKNHSEITFINIDKAWRLSKQIELFMKDKNILLIIDEAHKEKNPNAEITKAVLELTKLAKARIILTGTPMPNGYEDLYSLFKIYSPYEKILPFAYGQLSSFTKNGISEKDETNLMESIRPYFSRVSKKYLIERKELLEPKIHIKKCSLTPEQYEIYDFLNNIAYTIDNDFDEELNMNLMRAVLIRKMQVSSNPALLSKSIVTTIDEYKRGYAESFEDSLSQTDLLIKADNEIKQKLKDSKIYYLIDKFEKGLLDVNKNNLAVELAIKLINENKKVILWDVFVQNMNQLKRLFEKKGVSNVEMINGSVSGEDRQLAIDNFRKGNSMVLIANPATLAESISLHKACQNAIYVNRNFNAAQFIQSKDRIHRINMPLGTTATYYFLINENTVDEEVNNRLSEKELRMLKILDSEEIIVGGNDFENNTFMSDEDVIKSYRK